MTEDNVVHEATTLEELTNDCGIDYILVNIDKNEWIAEGEIQPDNSLKIIRLTTDESEAQVFGRKDAILQFSAACRYDLPEINAPIRVMDIALARMNMLYPDD